MGLGPTYRDENRWKRWTACWAPFVSPRGLVLPGFEREADKRCDGEFQSRQAQLVQQSGIARIKQTNVGRPVQLAGFAASRRAPIFTDTCEIE